MLSGPSGHLLVSACWPATGAQADSTLWERRPGPQPCVLGRNNFHQCRPSFELPLSSLPAVACSVYAETGWTHQATTVPRNQPSGMRSLGEGGPGSQPAGGGLWLALPTASGTPGCVTKLLSSTAFAFLPQLLLSELCGSQVNS